MKSIKTKKNKTGKHSLPADLRLLILLSGPSVSRADLGEIDRRIAQGIDWDGFPARMQFHRLVFPVLANLKDPVKSKIPAGCLGRISEIGIRQRLKGLNQARHTLRIAEVFGQDRLPVLFLKGICLSSVLYGDPVQRHAGDIDLLISPKDFFRAETCLLALGFERVDPPFRLTPDTFRAYSKIRFHTVYRSKDRAVAELHWRPFSIDAMFPVGFDTLWKQRQTRLLNGVPVASLDHRHNVLFLMVHGSRHGWERLVWLKDVADYERMLAPADREGVAALADKYGLSHILREARALARRFHRVPGPAAGPGTDLSMKIVTALQSSAGPSVRTEWLRYLRHFIFFNRRHRGAYLKFLLQSKRYKHTEGRGETNSRSGGMRHR